MFQKILIPLDGSSRAECALPIAARIARSTGASLLLLRVVYPPLEYTRYTRILAGTGGLDSQIAEAEVELAKSYLRQIALSDLLAGIEVEIRTAISTTVAQTILELANKAKADMIVLNSHGYTGLKRWALGGVAHKLTHNSSIPLLILHDEDESQSRISKPDPQSLHVMVALDGSTLSESALEPAIHLGVALSAPESTIIHLVEIVSCPEIYGYLVNHEALNEVRERIINDTRLYLEEVKKTILTGNLAYRNLQVTTSVLNHEDVARTLVEIAQNTAAFANARPGTNHIDILALATHGRGGLEHWALGSTTERVLNTTKQPVFVVHANVHTPEKERFQGKEAVDVPIF